jgi:hypothetical protein
MQAPRVPGTQHVPHIANFRARVAARCVTKLTFHIHISLDQAREI